MKKIIADFDLVTPMFCSGADQSQFELRGASLKGALQFWWRALAWGRLGGDLKTIHAEERKIFGSSDSGQGCFLLRCRPPEKKVIRKKEEILTATHGTKVGSGITYLGYGLMAAFPSAKRGQLSRPCLLAPDHFQLEILFRTEVEPSVLAAVKALGLLGGLGSRSRKGFGSLALRQISGDCEAWTAPVDIAAYQQEIERLLSKRPQGLPPYTAFSAQSRVTLLDEGDDPLQLMERVGERMQRYRSWGNKGSVNGKPAERNFRQDHDLAQAASTGKPVQKHPQRCAFGLPHNYFFSSTKGKADVKPADYERRASPLMFHFHQFASGQTQSVAVLLPAAFLPAGSQIAVGRSRVSQQVDYQVLHRFIDGRIGPADQKTNEFYFPQRKDLLPVLSRGEGM